MEVVLGILHHRELHWLPMGLPRDTEAPKIEAGHTYHSEHD